MDDPKLHRLGVSTEITGHQRAGNAELLFQHPVRSHDCPSTRMSVRSFWIAAGWQHRHGKAAHALCAVDQDALDIRGGGWASHQNRVTSGLEPRVPISLMQVADDAGWIEEDKEMLREVGQRIHFQLVLAEPD